MTTEVATEEGLHIIGEVALGFPPPPNTYRSVAYANTQPDAPTATWLTVRPDGTITAYAGKVEYGQGIRWGLTVEVAEELRAPIESVDVVLGDTGRVPWDMGTFGSQSTARVGQQLRKAAATARQALLDLAADRLDLPAERLACTDGRIVPEGDDSRALTYGELLAGQEITQPIDDEVALTPADEFSIMGTRAPRVDAVARVTGEAVYSQDVMVDGMLFAAVLRPPSRGAKLLEADTSLAERAPGVVSVLRDDTLIAVLAATDEQAERGLSLIDVTWDEQTDQPSTIDLPEVLLTTPDEGFRTQEAGSLEEGFAQADAVLESTYFAPYISNACMEPRAAVARWEGDQLTVWAGTQRPFGIRAELAQLFEMEEHHVRVIAPEIGGGFGSKSPYRPALEAARLAKLAGRPVRVAFTREEEMSYASFRPAAIIKVKSGFMSDGKIVAWQFDAYHAGERPFLGRRGSETPYDTPNVAVTAYTSQSPMRTGSYRSLGGAVNHFARESHLDEIAAQTGIDPVEMRLRNLTHPRFRRVLEAAAERFGWSASSAPSNRGVGCAIGLDVGSYVGMCLELRRQGSEVIVDRAVAALDCGLTVNPEGAINQVEGSIVMGLGGALYEAIDFSNGRVLNGSFARYRVPRITNSPKIDVVLCGDPDTPPTGAGEPGIVPVAPAVANALFDLTGERVHELPVQRQLR